MSGEIFNVKEFGAKADNATDDTQAIQAAIDAAAGVGGGVVFFPPGHYRVSPQRRAGRGDACLCVSGNNIVLEGCGPVSVIKTTQNRHVPILFSTQPHTTFAPTSALNACAVRHLTIQGTGSPEYFALSSGRGILARRVRDFEVEGCIVLDLSTVGICVEGGEGYISIHDNRVDNCFYTAINFNGRAYQSRIAGNIVSRALFPGNNGGYSPNSSLIQADGTVIIEGNTVYDSGGAGIMWGEADYHGVGVIANNLVKDCRSSGIKVAYHGPCTIQGNSVIGCTGGAGIFLQGGLLTGNWRVESKNNAVSGNLIVNCYSYGIACYTRASNITGNQISYIKSPVQPTSDETQPDYLSPGTRTEVGIVLNRQCYATVVGNMIGSPADAPDDRDAPQYGIAIPFGDKSHVIEGNQVVARLSSYIFTSPANQYGILAIMDGYSSNGNGGRQTGLVPGLSVTPNAWRKGDLLSTLAPEIGKPPAWAIAFDLDTVTLLEVPQHAMKMYVASAAGVAVGDVVVAEMSTHTLFDSLVTAIGADNNGSFVTLRDAATFSILAGAYVQFYRTLPYPSL
ncbi:MAG: right-handed parallel beta-helix repeat-containing protein [Anaerolineae bacterium]